MIRWQMCIRDRMETEQLEKIIQGPQKDQMMDDIAVQKAVDFLVSEAK